MIQLHYHPGNASLAPRIQMKQHAESRVGAMLDRFDEQMASHGGDLLLGSTFSAVDLYALTLCGWTRNFARPARSLPRLADAGAAGGAESLVAENLAVPFIAEQ